MRKNLGSEAERFVKVENWGEQLSESSSFVSIKHRWVEWNHKLAAALVHFSQQARKIAEETKSVNLRRNTSQTFTHRKYQKQGPKKEWSGTTNWQQCTFLSKLLTLNQDQEGPRVPFRLEYVSDKSSFAISAEIYTF